MSRNLVQQRQLPSWGGRETRGEATWETGPSGPRHSFHSSQMRSEVRKKGGDLWVLTKEYSRTIALSARLPGLLAKTQAASGDENANRALTMLSSENTEGSTVTQSNMRDRYMKQVLCGVWCQWRHLKPRVHWFWCHVAQRPRYAHCEVRKGLKYHHQHSTHSQNLLTAHILYTEVTLFFFLTNSFVHKVATLKKKRQNNNYYWRHNSIKARVYLIFRTESCHLQHIRLEEQRIRSEFVILYKV